MVVGVPETGYWVVALECFSHVTRHFSWQNVNRRLDQVLVEKTAHQQPSEGSNAALLPLEAEYLSVLGNRMASNMESLLFHFFQLVLQKVDDDAWSRKENHGIVSSMSSMTREAKHSLARLALEPLQDGDGNFDGLEWWSRSKQTERIEFVREITSRLLEQFPPSN
jgi:hypothetical protein